MFPSDLLESDNKQVLVETFRNLVRYALLKTSRDGNKLGVDASGFSMEALDASLSARENAVLFGNRIMPSVKELLEGAHERSLIFQFYWNAPAHQVRLESAFALSYEPDGDLKVRLLWLGIPERIPISHKIGPVGGLEPLEETVAELLRTAGDGRLAPYEAPR